jgi:hypothetical protein
LTVTREDGLELKGIGAFAITIAPDREWIRDSFEVEIADCPEWLLPRLAEVLHFPTGDFSPVHHVTHSHVSLSADILQLYKQVSTAREGSRHRTLLSVGGRAAYLCRHGVLAEEPTRDQLTTAGMECGLPRAEAARLLSYCFTHDILKAGEGRGSASYIVGALRRDRLERDSKVLAVVCEHFGEQSPVSTDVFSKRYVATKAGISKDAAGRALDSLLERRLIWEGAPKRLQEKQRQARRFKPTFLGLDVHMASKAS